MAAKLRRLSSRLLLSRLLSGWNQNRRRRGSSIIYIVVAMFVITGIVSFGVDVGWVRVARNQLQTAADASALAGALSLPEADSDAAKGEAIGIATNSTYNMASTAVSMQNGDIDLGLYWPPTQTFYTVGTTLPDGYTVEETDSNAMRVRGFRTAARSNPLPLFFARIFGKQNIDVNATATAYVRGGPSGDGFGIIGLTTIHSEGTTATIDSYLPPNFTPVRHNAKVASNGSIDLGNGDIYGDARPGVNEHLYQGPTSIVTGWTAPLTEPLVFPPATVPSGAIPLGNFTGSTLTAGTYSATQFTPADNFTITGGVAHIYVNGNVTLGGNLNVNVNAQASNFRVYVIGDHNVRTQGVSTIRCWLYCPESDMRMRGTTNFWGAIVAKSIDANGTAAIHYDESHGGTGDDDAFTAVLIK